MSRLFVEVIVTFYNAYGQVVGTDQRAPFELIESSGSIPMDQTQLCPKC